MLANAARAINTNTYPPLVNVHFHKKPNLLCFPVSECRFIRQLPLPPHIVEGMIVLLFA